MFTLTQAVSRVASRLNKNANDTAVYTRIKNHINDTCLEKWDGYAWSFRFRDFPLVLTAEVTSGTMTATNGSQTVTASGTPFDSSVHRGQWITFTGDTVQSWYRIVTVNSTSSVTIQPAYQGTSGGSKLYRLATTDYILATEITDVGSLTVTYNGVPLRVRHQNNILNTFQQSMATGTPQIVTVLNQDQRGSSYSTGTVSGTINTPTLTGVGTTWLSNIQPGDEIVITGDTNTYRVFNVDSDTSITLYNNLAIAPSAAAYTATRQFGKVLRLDPSPDKAYVCFIKGLRAYSPLVNTADTNEMLVRYPFAVIEGAIWREAGASPDPREDSLYMKSEKMWMTAQGEDEALFGQQNNTPIYDPRQGR
jgi:hypothetical protein